MKYQLFLVLLKKFNLKNSSQKIVLFTFDFESICNILVEKLAMHKNDFYQKASTFLLFYLNNDNDNRTRVKLKVMNEWNSANQKAEKKSFCANRVEQHEKSFQCKLYEKRNGRVICCNEKFSSNTTSCAVAIHYHRSWV